LILIEGRNREIRKMFEEIGHHVEKIRRIGYGPLVLDVEPGKVRELTEKEVEKLKRAAKAKPARTPQREPKRERPLPHPARLKKAPARRSSAKKGRRPASRRPPRSQ
jgi:23S rRNA pseudouridine2605 synthase